MTVAEVINVPRRSLFLFANCRARTRRRSFSRAMNLFSCAGFFNHGARAQKNVNRAQRQSNFGRRGVNAGKRTNRNENGCVAPEIRAANEGGCSDVRASQPSHGCL